MQGRNNKLLKKLDKWIGCPLIYLLGLIHTKHQLQPIQKKNPNIMILKTAGIGDTILTDAVIQEIKADYPQARITFVCSKSNASMTKVLSSIDHVYEFNMKRPVSSLLDLYNMGHFDLLLDFAPWARINAVMSYIVHADFKLGFKRKGMYRHYIYDKAVEHSDGCHEVDNYRHILEAAGLTLHAFNPHFRYLHRNRYTLGSMWFFIYIRRDPVYSCAPGPMKIGWNWESGFMKLSVTGYFCLVGEKMRRMPMEL